MNSYIRYYIKVATGIPQNRLRKKLQFIQVILFRYNCCKSEIWREETGEEKKIKRQLVTPLALYLFERNKMLEYIMNS